MRPLFAATAALTLMLTACGPREDKAKAPEAPAVAPLAGFVHDPAVDVAGYYRPAISIQIGNYKLSQIAVGAPSDFAEWEAGRREGLFGPVLLEFDDVTSPVSTNELGAEVHDVRIRVLPQAYRLSQNQIAFRGQDAKLGLVAFEGAFDKTAFDTARKDGSSGDKAVMIGALTVGENTIKSRNFTFWAGD